MGVETEKYIRKPLYVDAVRVTPQNFDEIAAWCQGEVDTEETLGTGVTKKFIKVRVHNPKNPRQTKAFVGDWILYTERGYKVYTNKAFRGAFDQVAEHENDDLNESSSEAAAKASADIRSVSVVTEDPSPETGVQPIESAEPVEEEPVEAPLINEDHEDEHTTPQGEPHEYVEATPEAIAEVVNEQQPPKPGDDRDQWDTPIAPPPTPAITPPEVAPEPEAVSEQPPEVAASGKRVLSEEEQRQMGPDAVRELVSTGEVILAQDLETEVR